MSNEVLELGFNSVDDINNAINYSAPAPPDERVSQRNWQIWSVAQGTRMDSGYPAVYKWFSGQNAPASAQGINGDLYLRSDGTVYQKQNNAWVIVASIKGDPGDTGTAATLTVGTVVSGETPSVTNTGDANHAIFNFVLPKGDTGSPAGFDNPTATIHALDAGASPTVTVAATGSDTLKKFAFAFGVPRGEQGEPGEGNRWFVGSKITGTSQEPSSFLTGIALANAGDLYLNNGAMPDTGRVYVCTQSGDQSTALWAYSCIIRGADGSGSGDMAKSVYDTNADGIVDDSSNLGGNPPSYYQKNTENLTADTVIADNDYLPYYDTSASANKKTLWSTLLGAIKSYLDSIYTTALLKLTGYSKPDSASAVTATDTINSAIGKLDKALDGKEATGTASSAVANHDSSADAHTTLFGAKQNVIDTVGILKGTGDAIQSATAGVDYQAPLTAGTDYQTPLTAGVDYQTPLTGGDDYVLPSQLSSYLTLTGGTMTGSLNLKGYSEEVEAMSGTTISPGRVNNFTKTINGNTSFTISSANMISGRAYAVTVVITVGATTYPVTWSSITWETEAPELGANTVTEVILRTYDGGVKWYGSVGGVFNVGA